MPTLSITTPAHFQQHLALFNVAFARQAFENGAITCLWVEEGL
jgi:hypothetical protein